MSGKKSDKKLKMSGQYEVSWPEYTSNRTACLSDLLTRNVFVDVTLVFDDNDQVTAHKVILSSASSFFQNLLEKNPHPNPMLYMRGMTKKHFVSLLDFIYLGEVSLPESDFNTFINMARDLKIKGLLNESQEKDSKKKTQGKKIKPNMMKKPQTNLSETTNTIRSKIESDILDPLDDPDDPPYEDFGSILDRANSFENEKTEQEKITENKVKIEQEKVTENKVKNEPVKVFTKSPDNPVTMVSGDLSNPVNAEIYAKVNALLITTPEGFWVCNECRYGSKSKENVMEHAEMHIKGIVHKCNYCNKTFQKKLALRNHMNKCVNAKSAHK